MDISNVCIYIIIYIVTSREDVNLQLDSIQGDLESIKELFKGGEDYTMDSSALMSVSVIVLDSGWCG